MEPIFDRLACVAFWVAASLEFSIGLGGGVGGVPYTLDKAESMFGWRVVGASAWLKSVIELDLSWS